MIGSAIYELAAGSSLLAAADFERTIEIWGIPALHKVCQIKGDYIFGNGNLAVHPQRQQICVGTASARGKVAGYDAKNGKLLWRRPSLPYPGQLRYSFLGDLVYCSIDKGRVLQLDSSTGDTVVVIQDSRGCFEGEHCIFICPSSGLDYRIRQKSSMEEVRLKKSSFAALDVVLTEDTAFLTESGGAIISIDTHTGYENWRYSPPKGSHALKLHWGSRLKALYAVVWHYEGNLFRNLLRLEEKDGQAGLVCEITNSSGEAFIEATQSMITTNGDIIDLSSGRMLDKIPFPQKEYQGIV